MVVKHENVFLSAVKKQTELNSSGIAELTDLFMNFGSKA
nr:MAG TPA: hypothetical protein [Caudoviricetes sp.]